MEDLKDEEKIWNIKRINESLQRKSIAIPKSFGVQLDQLSSPLRSKSSTESTSKLLAQRNDIEKKIAVLQQSKVEYVELEDYENAENSKNQIESLVQRKQEIDLELDILGIVEESFQTPRVSLVEESPQDQKVRKVVS